MQQDEAARAEIGVLAVDSRLDVARECKGLRREIGWWTDLAHDELRAELDGAHGGCGRIEAGSYTVQGDNHAGEIRLDTTMPHPGAPIPRAPAQKERDMSEPQRHCASTIASALKVTSWALLGALITLGAVTVTSTVTAARAIVRPAKRKREPVRVMRADEQAYTLTTRAVVEARAPGSYTVLYRDGVALLGDIVEQTRRSVTRRVVAWNGAAPWDAQWVRYTSAPELTHTELEIPVEDVEIATELGALPAWLFPQASSNDDWAIHVHGRGASRREPLRGVRQAHREGWTSLVISYRNDADWRPSADGRYGLGLTEAQDVAAALRYARSHGATRIMLVGWSMGGAAVLATLLDGDAEDVVAIMLESPVTSWLDVFRFEAREIGLLPWIAPLAWRLLRSPLAPLTTGVADPLELERLEVHERGDELRVPILILHSKQDRVVPYRSSRRLHRLRPELVQLEIFPRGLHTRLWNDDPTRWNDVVRAWFRRHRCPRRAER